MSIDSAEVTSGASLHFRDYLLENVYLRISEAERGEIVALWREEVAGIEGAKAERNSREAVYLVRAPSGELAGVSAVALVRLKGGQRFYSMTLLLRKGDRVPYLMVAVCNATRDFLRNFKHPIAQPAGILNINENAKLMRPGMRRIFARNGYQYWGQTARGEDVWATVFSQPAEKEIPAEAAAISV